MPVYYVSIPCHVTKDRPAADFAHDRVVHVAVEADSQAHAIEKFKEALVAIVQIVPEAK